MNKDAGGRIDRTSNINLRYNLSKGYKRDMVMKKFLSILLIITVVLTTCSCTVTSASAPGTQYGSFTIKKTSSYDGKYYAFMTQNDQMIGR